MPTVNRSVDLSWLDEMVTIKGWATIDGHPVLIDGDGGSGGGASGGGQSHKVNGKDTKVSDAEAYVANASTAAELGSRAAEAFNQGHELFKGQWTKQSKGMYAVKLGDDYELTVHHSQDVMYGKATGHNKLRDPAKTKYIVETSFTGNKGVRFGPGFQTSNAKAYTKTWKGEGPASAARNDVGAAQAKRLQEQLGVSP